MAKLLIILLIGLLFESTGVVLLKSGMNQLGPAEKITAREALRVVMAGATNANILLGVFFEALFFACLLVLMAKSDISFLWPLTALSFVFATFAATWFLHEKVSNLRWVGVVLIMAGAALITYSEQKKAHSPPPAAGSTSTPASQ